jgi:hypothetical protein
MSTFWALVHARIYANRPQVQNLPAALSGAFNASAVACLVDYTITPKRLTPGYEHRLSGGAMAIVYGGFAIGLAIGCLIANHNRHGRE